MVGMEELFGLIFEILVNTLFSVPIEASFSVKTELKKKDQPGCLYTLLYIAIGGTLGFISVLLFPAHIIPEPVLRMANLAVSPIIVGLISLCIAKQRQGMSFVIMHFFNPFLMALTFSLVRLAYCK
jgi:hypothetical protein